MLSRLLPPRARSLFLATLASFVACTSSDRSTATMSPVSTEPQLAKAAATSVSITSVSPDSGALSTTLDVVVNGNGFADGMIAIWELAGVPDSTQIRTNSTRFVSAKQVVANITITGRATSGQWDVAMYSGTKTGVGSELAVLKNGFRVTDPTATWQFPLSDAALAIRSDHLFASGTTSDYADGVCGVTATIFATTQLSNTGDATLNSGNTKGHCARHVWIVFPDGYSEQLPIFGNLRELENTTYSIPIGATLERQLHIGVPSSNVSSRCDGLIWGYGATNNIAIGSDSVLVTRVDAATWHVVSQPAPHNLAYCRSTGQLFPMAVDFTVISSRPLS